MWLTGMTLTGRGLGKDVRPAYAEFANCGQGLRTGGDVKLRGVLVGRIGQISRQAGGNCRVEMELFPSQLEVIPANSGAQIRAKTIFGEKWVELLYPDSPSGHIAQGDVIPVDRTIDPLEVETILNTALPLLEAIDPEALAGALGALADGFSGHEEAAIRGIEQGNIALKSMIENENLVEEGLRQLEDTGEVLNELDEDLIASLDKLDDLNRFTTEEADLLAENLTKAPRLLNELGLLFEVRFFDLTRLIDRGATVIGVLSARASDLDRLLDELPKFNSNWIRNLNHVCRFRQPVDEPGRSMGDPVPGRCWRVHNIISTTQGGYDGRGPDLDTQRALGDFGIQDLNSIGRLLFAPAILRTAGR
ncbi:MAG TPA: MCE family protein [Actinomycetota bacterium]|nr:MCE family protein [Actinomycetota bacterium]